MNADYREWKRNYCKAGRRGLFKALEEYLEADIAEEFDDEDDLLEEL